jgi:hypothetical protein
MPEDAGGKPSDGPLSTDDAVPLDGTVPGCMDAAPLPTPSLSALEWTRMWTFK